VGLPRQEPVERSSNQWAHLTEELRVKRAIVLLTAAAVAVVPAVSEAAVRKKPTKRVVTWSYTGFHGASTPAANTAFESPCTVNADACYDLQTFKYETSVKVEGGSVAIQYFLDDTYSDVQTLCGTGTIPVKKGTLVTLVTVLDASCPGVPTAGDVKLTVTGLK
jgi:hypothetical protein